MNESLSEFIFYMTVVVFFVAAVTLYFVMNGFSNDMVDFVRSDINSQNEIIQIIEEKKELTVSGEEILSDILSGSFEDLDLTVDGVGFGKSAGNPYEFDNYHYIDPNARYVPEAVFNASGDLTGVIYEKK